MSRRFSVDWMVNKESNPYSKLWGNYTLLLGGHLIYNIAGNSSVFWTLFFVRNRLQSFYLQDSVSVPVTDHSASKESLVRCFVFSIDLLVR